MTPQIHGFRGPRSRSGVIAAGVMGAVLLLAAAWIANVRSRPASIRVAFANSLTGPSNRPAWKAWSRRGLSSMR